MLAVMILAAGLAVGGGEEPAPNLEVIADGGRVIASSAGFRSRADRVSYDGVRGRLTLEGDGKNPAKLWVRRGGTWEELVAHKIIFSPGSHQVVLMTMGEVARGKPK